MLDRIPKIPLTNKRHQSHQLDSVNEDQRIDLLRSSISVEMTQAKMEVLSSLSELHVHLPIVSLVRTVLPRKAQENVKRVQ